MITISLQMPLSRVFYTLEIKQAGERYRPNTLLLLGNTSNHGS